MTAENQTFNLSSLFQKLSKAVPTLLLLGVIFAGWLTVHHLTTGTETDASDAEEVDDQAMADTLSMPSGKLKAGKFLSEPAQSRAVQHLHRVPGRIRYDETKHVEVKAPLDGMLAELLVVPGQQVARGELLAVLRSPEIGQARSEILKRVKQLEIAHQLLDREDTLFKNLEGLSRMLDRREPIESIQKTFTRRALGVHRQDLLASYAKLLLTSNLLDQAKPLAESGSIAGRTIREREAEQQIAEVAFSTSHDQALFTARQARTKAEADVAEAERQVNLAWETLDSLLGYREDKSSVNLNAEDSLSRLEVRAPFAGSVESRGFAQNERVRHGDALIVLANTDSLYVAASIRESDWSAVSLQPGTPVTVTVPALNDRVFDATIHYVGREVATDTNAVPLIAQLDNTEELLRPGMFVRVSVPIGEARQALSIKPESVIQHENQQFVFVDLSGGTFKRVDVDTGLASEEWVEVTKGLSPGQLVVTNGAFLLKSELLLQGDGE